MEENTIQQEENNLQQEEKKSFKIYRKSSELMWLLGVIFVALGVALCKKAD